VPTLALLALASCGSSGGGGSAAGPSGEMAVLPPVPYAADGFPGGPFEEVAHYTVRNDGAGPLYWSAASSEAWVALSVASGVLASGASEEVSLAVNEAFAGAFPVGHYAALVHFSDLERGTVGATITASLDVLSSGTGPGELEVRPDRLSTGGPVGGPFDPLDQELRLTNPGSGAVQWSVSSDVAWLQVAPSAGTLAAGAQQSVTVSVLGAAGSLDTGLHAATLEFSDVSDGQPLVQVEVTLGVGATIENQAWLNVHGRPFIPIGAWNQPPWDTHVAYLKSLGINTYLNNGLTPPEPTNPQLLDLLEANDMWAILQYDAGVRAHPRVLGWLLGDEPDLRGVPPADVQASYDAIKSADPGRFIALNTMGNFYWDANFGNPADEPLYQAYTAIPDISSFDFYSVAGWHNPGWVYMPGAMVQFLRERYLDPPKPVWAVIEASDHIQTDAFPGPSAAQMRFEVWDSIIHGATAIHYFTIAFDPFAWTNLTPAIEQELARTNGQITALTEVILGAPPSLNVTSSEPSGLARNLALRRSGTTTWLFADNADMGYRSATITFTFPGPISSVTVYGEGRTITPSGNAFTDTFDPLEVHIYQVEP